MKGGTNQSSNVLAPKMQAGNTGKLQPTAEQIRYAKLAQMPGLEEEQIQVKINEVCEVTGKASDVVSVALHESNYDMSQAIQNIIDGNYDCLDSEWQTTSSKKKKNPIAANVDKNDDFNEDVENHVNENDAFQSFRKTSKSSREGRRGGRAKRIEDASGDARSFDDDSDKDAEERFGDRFERGGGFTRGRARGRGRGGIARGGASGPRRGGFGGRGGNFSGPGRGASRGRGRGFAKRTTRYDKDVPSSGKEEWATNDEPNSEEKESWEVDEDVDEKQDWTDAADSEEKESTEDWSHNHWIAPVSEDNTASLFANSIMASTAQDSWGHVNGPETNWGRTSPKTQEESLYRPENVDTAVIMSQRAPQASAATSSSESAGNDQHSRRTTYASSLHHNKFPSSTSSSSSHHQDATATSNLGSTLLGRNYLHADDLAKVTMKDRDSEDGKSAPSPPATMISGVHDSHKLEQEQLQQPPKSQRQQKPKRAQKTQTPAQPVQMPKSTVEELEHQLGGLEFGSGPSPEFGSDAKPSFSSNSPVTSTVFQQSPVNMTSTIHQEAVRHSVAIPEVSSTKMATVSLLKSSTSAPAAAVSPMPKSDRPKTPPGLSSLQEHQSATRLQFAPSSPRDITRLVQVPNPIPFPPNSRSASQNMATSAAPLSQSTGDDLQSSSMDGGPFSSTAARSALSIMTSVVQDNSSVNMTNDSRGSLSGQPVIDLGELPLGNHMQQQKQGSNAFAGDAYASANINKTPTAQTTVASFTKTNIVPPPGVLPSTGLVTYSSSTLASQVLGFSSTQTPSTATHTAPKTLPNTTRALIRGFYVKDFERSIVKFWTTRMLPMNMYPGMQQIPTGYPHSYYDIMGSNYQGNPHAQQQAAFLNAAATPMQYGYAYYPGMIPGTFPMPGGKGHMGGMQYQSAAYNTQHGSHVYSSGANQEFDKGSFQRAGSQSHGKNGQTTGSLSAGSSSSDHHSGYKSQFNQDTKSYQLNATPPSMNIPLPHGQNHMTSYAPYMVPHHASMLHQTAPGHLSHQQQQQQQQQLDTTGPLPSRAQPHHIMATTQQQQQQKRDLKAQGYGSSYWPGTQ
eukprot:gene10051-11080_t